VVDYPHGKIAMWKATKSRNSHVSTVATRLKTKFFCSV